MYNVDTDASFIYNENRLKTVNGVVTKYTLHGKNIVHMTQGSNELHFFYDAQNKPAVVVYNGTPYSYVKNLQGDIVAILNSAGTAVVRYVYDAWGRPISKTGSMASTLGTVQPFRYRGYVYDEETRLYYLRSRYYNPNYCRFLNADAILTRNTCAYCTNSPLIFSDKNGYSPDNEVGDIPDYTSIVIAKLEESIRIFKSHAVVFDPNVPVPTPVASYAPEYAYADLISIAANNIPNYKESYTWFTKQVALKGPWDLKNVWYDVFPDLLKPTKNNEVMFLGEPATSEDIGNFAYGFNGSAMGISPTMLYIGAGAAQYAFSDNKFAGFNAAGYGELLMGVGHAILNMNNYWGDTEEDNYWVEKGITYYNTYYGGS